MMFHSLLFFVAFGLLSVDCSSSMFQSRFGSPTVNDFVDAGYDADSSGVPMVPFRLQTGLKRCSQQYCCPTDTHCCGSDFESMVSSSEEVGFLSGSYCCKNGRMLGWPC